MATAIDLSIDFKRKFTVQFTDRNGSPVAGPEGVVPQFISSDDAALKIELIEGDPLSFFVVPGDVAGLSAEVHSVVGGDIEDGVLTVNLTGGAARKQELQPGELVAKGPAVLVAV